MYQVRTVVLARSEESFQQMMPLLIKYVFSPTLSFTSSAMLCYRGTAVREGKAVVLGYK